MKTINLFIYVKLREINYPMKRVILVLNRKLDHELEWYLDRI